MFFHFVSPSGKGRFFRFRLPMPLSMLGLSKQSLPQEDPDEVTVYSPEQMDMRSSCSSPSSLSLSLSPHELRPSTQDSCSPSYANDTKALIGQNLLDSSSPGSGPQDQSSPRDMKEKAESSGSAGSGSVCTLHRASSTHDLEGFNAHVDRAYRGRHASEGTCNTRVHTHYSTTKMPI